MKAWKLRTDAYEHDWVSVVAGAAGFVHLCAYEPHLGEEAEIVLTVEEAEAVARELVAAAARARLRQSGERHA